MVYTQKQIKLIQEKRPDLRFQRIPTLDDLIVDFLKKFDVIVNPKLNKSNKDLSNFNYNLLNFDENKNLYLKKNEISEWDQWKRWALENHDFEEFRFRKIKENQIYNKNILEKINSNDVKKEFKYIFEESTNFPFNKVFLYSFILMIIFFPLTILMLNFLENKENLNTFYSFESIEKTISIIRVLGHDDNAIAGASARGGYATPTSWHVSGSTNAQGLLIDLRNGKQTNLSYEARFNNTTAVVGPKDPTLDSYYLFQTNLLTLKLETCAGAPLSGGAARYGNGSTYSTWFFPGNNTDVNGEATAEMFPGTYSFEMAYQSTSEVKTSVVIPNSNTTLTWKTTNVTLNWVNTISYGGSGDSRYFNKPAMELLPGVYRFNFRNPGSNYMDLTIEGCEMNKTFIAVKLIDSDGNGLAGGEAKYYDGSWKSLGTTGANGYAYIYEDGPKGNLKFRMSWLGATQEFWQDISVDPVALFSTKKVNFKLLSSENTELTGETKFYSNTWQEFGTGQTTSSMELLNHETSAS